MRRKGIAYKLLALLLLASCQRESSVLEQDYPLSFSVETGGSAVKSGLETSAFRSLELESEDGDLSLLVQEEDFPGSGLSTKASVYTGASLPTDVSLGFIAYKYTASGASPENWTLYSSPAVMEAVYDGSRSGRSPKWVPTTRLLWPGSGYVRYFAYAPKEVPGAAVTASNGSAPQISLIVPASYDQQVDLLVANAASCREYDGDPEVTAIDVPMTLEHVLTGIRFRVGKGLSITSVSINGVRNKGTFPLEGTGSHTWALDGSSSASFTLSNPALKSDGDSYDIVEDEYVLMLLPQTLPAGARIVATVSKGGATKTISAIMGGEVWAPGKLMTYTITSQDNVP